MLFFVSRRSGRGFCNDESRAGVPHKDRSWGPCVQWVGLVGSIGGYHVPQESFLRSRAEAEVWHISVQLILLAWTIWFGRLSKGLVKTAQPRRLVSPNHCLRVGLETFDHQSWVMWKRFLASKSLINSYIINFSCSFKYNPIAK